MTLTPSQHQTIVKTMNYFRTLLASAAEKRPQRSEVVHTTDGPQLGWVIYEREIMHAAVNRLREQNGLPAVDLDVIERVESLACGHIDYAKKFSLYCAELTSPALNAIRRR